MGFSGLLLKRVCLFRVTCKVEVLGHQLPSLEDMEIVEERLIISTMLYFFMEGLDHPFQIKQVACDEAQTCG